MSELAHYGVKGMKWGVRRKEQLPTHKDYKPSNQALDKNAFGKRGVRRINKRLHEGKSYKQAVVREAARRAATNLVKTTTTLAVLNLLNAHGGQAVSRIQNKAATNRGKAHARNQFVKARGIETVLTKGTQNRKGIYNITTL